VRRP